MNATLVMRKLAISILLRYPNGASVLRAWVVDDNPKVFGVQPDMVNAAVDWLGFKGWLVNDNGHPSKVIFVYPHELESIIE